MPPAGTWRLGAGRAHAPPPPRRDAAQPPRHAAVETRQPDAAARPPSATPYRPSPTAAGASRRPLRRTRRRPCTASTVAFSIRPLSIWPSARGRLIAALLIARIAWRQARLWRMLRGRRPVTDDGGAGDAGGATARRRPLAPRAPDGVRRRAHAAGAGRRRGLRAAALSRRTWIPSSSAAPWRTSWRTWRGATRRGTSPSGSSKPSSSSSRSTAWPALRLRESAEFLCDEWAARQTGSPLGLARCLAEVASWVAPGRAPIPAGTMAMAEGGSPLVQRVQRLTAWRGGSPRGERDDAAWPAPRCWCSPSPSRRPPWRRPANGARKPGVEPRSRPEWRGGG